MYKFTWTCLLHSVTKGQQHLHAINPVATEMHNLSIRKQVSNTNTEMTAAASYSTEDHYVIQNIIGDEDEVEYDYIDPRLRKVNTYDIKMDQNPAYAETKFK